MLLTIISCTAEGLTEEKQYCVHEWYNNLFVFKCLSSLKLLSLTASDQSLKYKNDQLRYCITKYYFKVIIFIQYNETEHINNINVPLVLTCKRPTPQTYLKHQSELYSEDKTFKEPDQWFNMF